jgi:hypothetical protein
MTEYESERKRPRAPLSSQGVMALLERWVSDLERDDPFSHPQEPQAPVSPPERPRPEPIPRNAVAEKDPTHSIRAARKEIRLQGWGAILPPGDAQIVLSQDGGRLVHRGTVGVRGPCAPTRRELLELGWTEDQARALEFVLAWFGAPFDSLTWDPQGEGELRWGAWPLAGSALIEALGRWHRRDPQGFEARLGRLGVEAASRPPPEASSLTLLDLEGGQPAEGRQALALMGEDPRLFAALAQAGREQGAQLSQLEYVLEQILRPTLAYSGGSTSPAAPSDGPFSTPRALALLLHAELRLGRRGVARLVAHTRELAGKPGAGEQAGLLFAADLHAAGRTREAAEVRRILSSPELADVPA